MKTHIGQEFIRFMLLFIASIAMVTAVVITLILWEILKVPFWIFFPFVQTSKTISLFILPIVLLLTGIWWLRDNHSNRKIRPMVSLCSFILAILATVLGCSMVCLYSAIIFLFSGRYSYRADATAGNHTYYVDSAWKPGVGSIYLASFFMNECNDEGLNCRIVYEQEYRRLPLDTYEKMTVSLSPDSVSNTISLKINGETVYTYHIK